MKPRTVDVQVQKASQRKRTVTVGVDRAMSDNSLAAVDAIVQGGFDKDDKVALTVTDEQAERASETMRAYLAEGETAVTYKAAHEAGRVVNRWITQRNARVRAMERTLGALRSLKRAKA